MAWTRSQRQNISPVRWKHLTGNGCLQGIEAVIQRQQRVLAEGDDDGLFLEGEHR